MYLEVVPQMDPYAHFTSHPHWLLRTSKEPIKSLRIENHASKYCLLCTGLLSDSK